AFVILAVRRYDQRLLHVYAYTQGLHVPAFHQAGRQGVAQPYVTDLEEGAVKIAERGVIVGPLLVAVGPRERIGRIGRRPVVHVQVVVPAKQRIVVLVEIAFDHIAYTGKGHNRKV